jgi:hypothetical protein
MVDTGPKHIWLHEILSDLGAALGHPDSDLINLFEAQVRERLLLGAVRLREIPSHQHARLVAPTRSASAVVLAVPTTDVRALGVLEASARHGRLLDDHDCECLFVAANLGGFVLQASRTKSTPPVRHAQAPTLVGPGPAMRALRAQIERVASTDFTILIEGESGTGKELVARQIHDLSRRRLGPFVAVNCAAVVETLLEAELFGIEDRTATGVRGRRGKFESADGGTLFLDEVADLSPAAQAKLLRAVQEMAVERVGGVGSRRVNTRIVVATNKPLAAGPVLPLQRCGDSRAAAPRPPGGHPGARGAFPAPARRRTAADGLGPRGRCVATLCVARQCTRAAAARRTHRRDDRVRPDRAGRSACARARPIRGGADPLANRVRVDALLGEPVRQARLRALRAQQAPGLQAARYQLSHAPSLPPLSRRHTDTTHRAVSAMGRRAAPGKPAGSPPNRDQPTRGTQRERGDRDRHRSTPNTRLGIGHRLRGSRRRPGERGRRGGGEFLTPRSGT